MNNNNINELINWLSHPMEFGKPPQSIKLKACYTKKIIGWDSDIIELYEYRYEDGLIGRGVVGPYVWSFIGDAVGSIADEDYIMAYCGWAYLFSNKESKITIDEDLKIEVSEYLKTKDVILNQIRSAYMFGDSKLVDFDGTHKGDRVLGCADMVETFCITDASDPIACLPISYSLLGHIQNPSDLA